MEYNEVAYLGLILMDLNPGSNTSLAVGFEANYLTFLCNNFHL